MNIELEPSGISVCTINPSFHRTPIFKNTYSGVLESSMDDQDKTKAILSAKTLTCLASQVRVHLEEGAQDRRVPWGGGSLTNPRPLHSLFCFSSITGIRSTSSTPWHT
eukprot:7903821-Prorocentrum_lima.AAC.1